MAYTRGRRLAQSLVTLVVNAHARPAFCCTNRAYCSSSPSTSHSYAYIAEDVTPNPPSLPSTADIEQLTKFISSKRKLVVITGAGASTESGVPDYRSPNGSYSKGHKPTTYQEYVSKPLMRKRYWARSMYGYMYFTHREPNPTHKSLSILEHEGIVHHLITQNVDGLHQKAGHERVIELHGTNNTIICLSCRKKQARSEYQAKLQVLNPNWVKMFHAAPASRPDGDADLGQVDYSTFVVPDCDCGGIVKPEVVFFGENVPLDVVQKVMGLVTEADGVLVIGSSLQVFSVFRFIKAADQNNIPIVILNIGPTRADGMKSVEFKLEGRSGQVLPLVLEKMFSQNLQDRRPQY